MRLSMLARRFVAFGFLASAVSTVVLVSSCTNPECTNGADGCPCTTPYDCELPNSCYSAYCDGTCHVQAIQPGGRCWIFPCPHPDYCFGFCTAEPQCVECLDDEQCDAGHTCEVGGVCSRCDDGVKNGAETDVDCGGSCPLCPGTCNIDGDCPDGYCWQGSCVSCRDGVQNGDEIGVDCGGYYGHCGYCAGLYCQANNAQCASNSCEGGVCCAMQCPLCYECKAGVGECIPIDYGWADIYNTANPDVVCYGQYVCDGKGNCKLDLGNPCSQAEECVSGACINGTCK
jgi:hypothetical protein